MTWRRLEVLIEALARTPGTLLHRALADDDWTLDQHLLALVHDQLAAANWQRAGKRTAPRPKPVSPLAKRSKPTRAGAADRSPEEMTALLERYRTGAFDRG